MSKIFGVARAVANGTRQNALPKVIPPRPPQPRPAEVTYYVDNETYNKRRRLLWAGGMVVITAAGAILGAQFKALSETNDKQLQTQPSPDVHHNFEKPSLADRTKPPVQQSIQNASTIAQQIETLEATKAALRIQKSRLQEKVNRVRARRQANEAVDAEHKMNTKR